MASFDENGKYIKTDWKAGDKITATKLNKIEESIEAVNDNDISRHVEADTRLDALEAKDVAHDKEFTNIKNTIADNKAAAELGDYEINSRMQFLEEELNEGIEEVHNVAETVDGKINTAVTNVDNVASTVDNKIATAEANMTAQVNAAKDEMTAQVNQGKTDMEAMVAEVEEEMTKLQNDINGRLPLSGGILTGDLVLGDENSTDIKNVVLYKKNNSNGDGVKGRFFINTDNGRTMPAISFYNITSTQSASYNFGYGAFYPLNQDAIINQPDLGRSDRRWNNLYLINSPNVSSDRTLKENIEYVSKAKSELTYDDMYNFVRDDLGLATYNFIGQDKLQMNFIAQDLLANPDGTDNKIGQMIVEPVAVPPEEEIENGAPYPTLSYDMGVYTSVLAGALKEAINKIEQLEARINELENK